MSRTNPSSSPSGSRTFTESLRARGRDELITLLSRRPDLTYPPPYDLGDLAARATSPTSVARAIGQLDAWSLAVLHSLAAQTDPATIEDAAALLGGIPDVEVTATVAHLRELALVWGTDPAIHLVREVRSALGPYPGGLAAPAPRDPRPDEIVDAVAAQDEEATHVLNRLVWGPPTGVVRNAAQRRGDGTAIGGLLDTGLLRVLDQDTVIVPRTVAWAKREPQRLVRDLPPATIPLPPTASARPATMIDRSAVGAAFELVHDVEAAGELLSAGRFRVLRDGGIGVRDLGVIAGRLGQPLPRAALVLECASAAGLINAATNLTILPTSAFDAWVARDADDQWAGLVAGWLAARRWFARGTDRGNHVLGVESSLRSAPEIRGLVLDWLSRAHGRQVWQADLVSALAWCRPAWARNDAWPLSTVVAEVWPELDALGLVSLESASSLAPAIAAGTGPLPADLADLFPAPVAEVIVQADLTAVAPGPLRHDVAHDLALLADQESRGAGAVYRFSGSSLRRAFDAGWSHQEINTWLTAHSRTPIPQPLEYLVADTARLYGSVRVGHAWSYVRTEDETQAAAILQHPEAGPLGLRELAPGVLVANSEPEDVVAVLRQLGLHPAAEDETGHTVSAPTPLRAAAVRGLDLPDRTSAESAVVHLLAAENRSALAAATTEDVLSALVRAQEAGLAVDLSFVDANGSRSSTQASPVTIGSGTVRFSQATGHPFTVPLARISTAVVLDRHVGPAR